MNRYIISFTIIAIVGAYFWLQQGNSGFSISNNPSLTPTPSTLPATTSKPTSPGSNPTPTPVQVSGFKDGTYTSPVTDAVYGSLQFKVAISGGKISDIQFLQYPSDNGHSMEVSNYSLPILKQEAIQSQSANVQIVSGATQTSNAFRQAMATVLAQAK